MLQWMVRLLCPVMRRLQRQACCSCFAQALMPASEWVACGGEAQRSVQLLTWLTHGA